jgi:hypothetical protein
MHITHNYVPFFLLISLCYYCCNYQLVIEKVNLHTIVPFIFQTLTLCIWMKLNRMLIAKFIGNFYIFSLLSASEVVRINESAQRQVIGHTDVLRVEHKTLIYWIHYLIPWLHLSPFHPGLQPSLHTPVTGLHFSCLQLLHVYQQLRPYFPREHAKNNQHLIIESTNIVDKRGYN